MHVMATPLWLTADERQIFTSLPPSVQDGWEVREETQTFTDTAERRNARLNLMRLHDPKLLAFQEKVKKESVPEAIGKLLEETDMRDVAEDDLAELFFALGPDVLTRIITPLLGAAKNDGDVDDVASLLLIRHSLLASFSSQS